MKKSKDSIDMWVEHGIDVPARTVLLQGEVDEILLDKATTAFHLFSAKTDPITVLLNTPGGSVVDGMAIYDQIKNCKSHVTVRVVGEACSMGAVILQAGDHREAYENSIIMHHTGSNGLSDHNENFKLAHDFQQRYHSVLYKIMLDRVNERQAMLGRKPKTLAWWKKHDLWDRWMTTEEAIEWGFLDEIYRLKGTK